MSKSAIEWTDETDNVVVVRGPDGEQSGWYCQKVSLGCKYCYAEAINLAGRFGGNGTPYRVDAEIPPLMLRRDLMQRWCRQRVPHRHFINSMTDTFGEFVPEYWIREMLDAMLAAPRQTFQVLTKRARRMAWLVTDWLRQRGLVQVPDHIWLGVSVENQKLADRRLPHLLGVPARVRWLSCEPLLGPLALDWYLESAGIHWVVAGGESGARARPMRPEWARGIRDGCANSGTAFFFKQWGAWVPAGQVPAGKKWGGKEVYRWWDGEESVRLGKRQAGRLLDGRIWAEFPKEQSSV